ncbi:VanZ family protein [Marinobacter sp.]|uniref:VanZ family protein n=1 Tax=Marinobacter sp. TaxID=50741 RepID=UPI002B4A137F|nr:VanZ family protein [Marinobacter sp.]HKK56118.1 VanZ family protein [Marinobacter sp.]
MAFLKNSLQSVLMCQPLWRTTLVISAVAIMYLATTSQPYPVPSLQHDKINHLLAFIQLTVVSRLAWPDLSRTWIALGVIGFGLVIELTQAQLPYREFSLLDLAADGAGVAIGLLLCGFIFREDHGKSTRNSRKCESEP